MGQTFMNISAETCAKVYPAILQNSASHRRCAEILAKGAEYANAAAHLILATEELLKGFVILLESKGMRLREIDGFKKLFSDHKSRHYLLRDLIPIWIVIKEIADQFEEPTVQKVLKPNAPKWLNFVVSALNLAQEGLVGYMQYEFWKEADQIKKTAFYVDYDDQPLLPIQITEEVYSIVQRKVSRVTKEVLEFVHELESSPSAEIEAFISRAMDEDFRELLAKTINGKHSIFNPS